MKIKIHICESRVEIDSGFFFNYAVFYDVKCLKLKKFLIKYYYLQ